MDLIPASAAVAPMLVLSLPRSFAVAIHGTHGIDLSMEQCSECDDTKEVTVP